MKRMDVRALLIGAAFVGTAAIGGCATSAAAQDQPAAQPPAAAAPAAADASAQTKALFETQCSNCHELRIATGQRKTEDEWATTVYNMLAKGAPITQEQADEIIAYLAKNYGPDSK
jgi:mono/diheme cytochrome c family protein